jgi:hypothetical protein
LLGQRDGAESPLATGAQARSRRIEGDFLAGLDALGKARVDLGRRDRRGEEDAPRGGAAGKLGHGKEWRARERGRRINLRAAAIGQLERTCRTATVFRNPLGVGEGKKNADR